MQLCQSSKFGIYFQCQQCGRCCSHLTDGYIFVYIQDLVKMCENLQISLPNFARKYLTVMNYCFVIWDGTLEDTHQRKLMPTLILHYEKKHDCGFLEYKKEGIFCKIYQARPLQCELFPFWSQVITIESNFHHTAETCPGFQAQKLEENFYSPEQIQELVYRERKYEHDYYQTMKQADFDIFRVYPFLKDIRKIRHKLDQLQKSSHP